jgi:hypothetical protein
MTFSGGGGSSGLSVAEAATRVGGDAAMLMWDFANFGEVENSDGRRISGKLLM